MTRTLHAAVAVVGAVVGLLAALAVYALLATPSPAVPAPSPGPVPTIAGVPA